MNISKSPCNVKKTLKNGKKSLVLMCSLILVTFTSTGQTTIFTEDFGQHTTRVRCSYSPTGTNSFLFADPNTPDNPVTTVYYSGNEQIYANEIENNYYAVIAPANIYTTYASGYSAQYQLWKINVPDHTGNANGAVIAVNGGVTLNSFYKRQVALTTGTSYKLTFWLYVVNSTANITAKILSPSGNTITASLNTGDITASSAWAQYTMEFILPTGCSSGNYYVSIENTKAETSGNDFYVDDIAFASTITATAPVTFTCPSAEPYANNDISTGNTINTAVNISILTNDKLSNNSTTATTSNSAVTLLVPQGANQDQWSKDITIPGEGTWNYNTGTGVLKFTPVSGFTANPSPLSYTITETSTGTTSGSATVTITYTGNPKATSDTGSGSSGSPISLSILANDILADGTTVATSSNVSVKLIDTYGVVASGSTIVVVGEGTWVYSTGVLTFTPESGFSGSPTQISYKITETSTSKTSAPVPVIITATTTSVDYKITKTVDNISPNVGDQITFTLKAENIGSADATNVVVDELLDAGYEYVSCNPIGAYNNTTHKWVIGSLLKNSSTILTITVTVK